MILGGGGGEDIASTEVMGTVIILPHNRPGLVTGDIRRQPNRLTEADGTEVIIMVDQTDGTTIEKIHVSLNSRPASFRCRPFLIPLDLGFSRLIIFHSGSIFRV